MNKFETAIHEAIGLASMAWTETPTGTFDEQTAKKAVVMIIDAAPLDYIEEVAKFHRLFEHPILVDYSQLPTEDRMKLRHNLLKEEVSELAEAIQMKDIIGIADALADIQYVLSGAILEFGLQDKFPALFMEVQRSNMTKACVDQLEAQWTADQHKEDTGFDCFTKERDGKWFVYRSKDMKTIKSGNYSPADLATVLGVPPHGGVQDLIAD